MASRLHTGHQLRKKQQISHVIRKRTSWYSSVSPEEFVQAVQSIVSNQMPDRGCRTLYECLKRTYTSADIRGVISINTVGELKSFLSTHLKTSDPLRAIRTLMALRSADMIPCWLYAKIPRCIMEQGSYRVKGSLIGQAYQDHQQTAIFRIQLGMEMLQREKACGEIFDYYQKLLSAPISFTNTEEFRSFLLYIRDLFDRGEFKDETQYNQVLVGAMYSSFWDSEGTLTDYFKGVIKDPKLLRALGLCCANFDDAKLDKNVAVWVKDLYADFQKLTVMVPVLNITEASSKIAELCSHLQSMWSEDILRSLVEKRKVLASSSSELRAESQAGIQTRVMGKINGADTHPGAMANELMTLDQTGPGTDVATSAIQEDLTKAKALGHRERQEALRLKNVAYLAFLFPIPEGVKDPIFTQLVKSRDSVKENFENAQKEKEAIRDRGDTQNRPGPVARSGEKTGQT